MKGNIYVILSQIALFLLIVELIYCFYKKRQFFSQQEFIMNLGTAIINQFMNLAVLFIVIKSYGFLHDNYALTKIELNWWTAGILLLSIDFLFYWFHRWGHSINILWAAHSPHHSAEEMNLAVGLRASVTQRLFSFSMFWPLTLIGFRPEDIYIFTGIHLILGYWHHTRVIGKLGWFEKYFNTPSHHRVHHGTNEKYLDKNFAEIMIVWDKMFGTFQEELDEEPVCYGILRHPESWSPLKINFHFYGMLWQDCKETPRLWDKIRLWFMPLGWRPPGVSHRDPVKAYDLSEQVKFKTRIIANYLPYLYTNLLFSIGAMFFIINVKNGIGLSYRLPAIALVILNIHFWSYVLEGDLSKKLEFFLSLALATFAAIGLQSGLESLKGMSVFFALWTLVRLAYTSFVSVEETGQVEA